MSEAAEQSDGNDTPRTTPPVEGWSIEEATSKDADRLAAIQINAFKSNDLFKVQFPTQKASDGYRRFLAERIKEEIEHSHAHVLLIREWRDDYPRRRSIFSDISQDDPLAFAIWRPPYRNEDADLHASKKWPDETNVDMIMRWGEVVNETYRTAMKNAQCYRLDWLVTHKECEGLGLGTMLLNWGLDLARSRGLPVYLESTIVSERWYINRGFERVAEMSIPLEDDNHDAGNTYHEVGLLWRPKKPSGMVFIPTGTGA